MGKAKNDKIFELFKRRGEESKKRFDASIKRMTELNKEMRRVLGFPDINLLVKKSNSK